MLQSKRLPIEWYQEHLIPYVWLCQRLGSPTKVVLKVDELVVNFASLEQFHKMIRI